MDKILIEGESYGIFKQFPRKGDASAHAEGARRTGLFKNVRVVEIGKTSPLRVNGKWAVAVRGVARDLTNLTAESLKTETGAPDTIRYDRKTGRLKNW